MFKKASFATLALVLLSPPALARNTIADHAIKNALAHPKAEQVLGHDIKFFFGKQPHGKVAKDIGNFRTNQKTNAFGKSDEAACQWAFLSAMKSLRQRAEAEGGNAVINIRSNYQNSLSTSEDSYKCGAGTVMAGVALVGDVVVIK
ncbi:excinuclease ABC subunit A [Gallaecimonas kandeliae]|uniref:excinuclease ABC subunit A n=1 Tax=Gallaecimonas kandeliae TaxID=3029055 RepID=UPI002648E04B|nr:excinuclease ABC subunit A [Gallaecimonas kandeliae]WKE66292.1 excinuclease ABC subunit A [Gallaecimonas kandeliae]